MWFDGWSSLLRVVALAAATYAVLVAALRFLGDKALAKMSAYDMIVTISLGSILVSVALGPGVTLTDGLAAIVTILGLQEVTRRLVRRSWRARSAIRQHPSLVVWEGRMLPRGMEEVQVTPEEVRAALRGAGLGSFAEAQAVVLEADGSWSVTPRAQGGDLSAFEDFDLPRRSLDKRTG